MTNYSPHSASRAPSRLVEKYEVVKKVGDGAYSDVYKCRDRESDRIVIMKKFRETDEDVHVKKIGLREIRSMRSLNHPNIRRLIEVFKKSGKLHFILEYCDRTVLEELEKHKKGVPLPLTMSIIWQTLQGLNHCHIHNYIHRDIKPENILLTNDGVVKLADFGFARVYSPGETLTEYVATKWYRAPELLVGDRLYGPKVDVWAVGCIFAELVRGVPMWPGKSDMDQLFLICKNLGDLIPRHLQIFKANEFFTGMNLPNNGIIEPLEKKFPPTLAGPEGLDFLKKCIDKDPAMRLSCEQLLAHSFFKGFSFKYPKESEYEEKKGMIINNGSILPLLPSSTPSSSNPKMLIPSNPQHLPTLK